MIGIQPTDRRITPGSSPASVLVPEARDRGEGEPPITPSELAATLKAGMRVLDIGCNTGSFDYHAFPDLEIIGCDLLPPSPVPDLPNVQYRRLAGEDLDYPAESFDLIILNFILEHAEDPRRILKLCSETLRAGGVIYCGVPNSAHFEDRIFRSANRLVNILTFKPFRRIEHIQFFTEEIIRSMARDAGLVPTTRATVPAGFAWIYSSIAGLSAPGRSIKATLKAVGGLIQLGHVRLWLDTHRLLGHGDVRRDANLLHAFRRMDPGPDAGLPAVCERVFTHSCGPCGLPVRIDDEERKAMPHARKWQCPRCASLNIL